MRGYRPLYYSAAAVILAAACAVPPVVAAVTYPEPIQLSVPEPSGPHDIGQVDLHLVDESRDHPWAPDTGQREIMATVWYPAKDNAGGEDRAPYLSEAMADYIAGATLEQAGLPRDSVDLLGATTHAVSGADAAGEPESLPVVLYSPGFEQSRHLATAQVEELASHGYVVAAIDHPYETDAVEFPDGRVLRGRAPLDDQTHTEIGRAAVPARIADAELVLDALTGISNGDNPDVSDATLPNDLGEALDLSTVGMFGHSMGGFTAAELMVGDERVDAGIDLDGSVAYHVGDEVWAEATTRGVDRPFMIMAGGMSGGAVEHPHTSEHSHDYERFRELSGETMELYLPEAEHMSFMDAQWLLPQIDAGLRPDNNEWEAMEASIGTIAPERSVAAQRAHITAFFDVYLRGEEQPLLDGPSEEYPEVEFID